jgi:hypothetical protein
MPFPYENRPRNNLAKRFLETSHRLLSKLAHFFVLKGWLLKGKVLNVPEEISILYYGHKGVRNDLIHRIFNGDCEVRNAPLELVHQFKKRISGKHNHCDLLMLQGRDLPYDILSLDAHFYLPLFLEMEVDLTEKDGPLETRNSLRGARSRISKYDFHCIASKKSRDFDKFYYDIYVPSSKKRYGDAAWIHGYQDLKKKIHEILFLQYQGQTVAGAVCEWNFSTLAGYYWYWGIKDGSESIREMGVGNVMDYYVMLWSREVGMRKLNLGGVRPFLKDGVLQHKLRMGARFGRHVPDSGLLALWIFNKKKAVQDFLREQPFICYENPGIYRAVCLNDRSHAELQEEDACHRNHGLAGIRIYPLFENRSE